MRKLTEHLKHNSFELFYVPTDEIHHNAFEKIDPDQIFFTVILVQEEIDESLKEDPLYYVKIPVTELSLLDYELGRLMRKFEDENGSFIWIHDEIKKHYADIDKESNLKKWEEFDYYYSCQEKSQVATALKNCEIEWTLSLASDDTYELSDENLIEIKTKNPEKYATFLKEVFLPSFEYDYFLKYAHFIPDPLYQAGIGTRCQYFIIKKNDKIKIAMGNTDGSETRRLHGFCAHLFALIRKKYQTGPFLYYKSELQM